MKKDVEVKVGDAIADFSVGNVKVTPMQELGASPNVVDLRIQARMSDAGLAMFMGGLTKVDDHSKREVPKKPDGDPGLTLLITECPCCGKGLELCVGPDEAHPYIIHTR